MSKPEYLVSLAFVLGVSAFAVQADRWGLLPGGFPYVAGLCGVLVAILAMWRLWREAAEGLDLP